MLCLSRSSTRETAIYDTIVTRRKKKIRARALALVAWDLLFDPHLSMVRRTCTVVRQWALNFGSQKRSVGRREKEGVLFSGVVVRCGRSEPGVHWQLGIGQEAQFYRRPGNIADLAKPGNSRPPCDLQSVVL